MAGELQGKFKGLIFDMDGVLYRGDDALTGAQELFPALRAANLSFILLTNNATRTSQDFTAKLAKMGIDVEPERIMTSAGVTAGYLRANYPEGGKVCVLGEAGLVSYIESVPNFTVVDDDQADFVVVGLYYGFNYKELTRGCAAIRKGAHFIATNPDTTLPMEGGALWPGAGSIAAAVQTCSGIEPTIIGKPEIYGAEAALDDMQLRAAEVLCIGDRLETDIMMGCNAGIPTALVLTGVSSHADVDSTGIHPDYILDDLPALMAALGIDGDEHARPPESHAGIKG